MTGFKNSKKGRKKGKNRSWAQKKTYDGIQFQSLLEVYCYRKLKEAGLVFDYEMTKFVLMEGFVPTVPVWNSYRKIFKMRATPVRPITYTPDFVAKAGNWVIETKGWKSEGFKFRWKLFLRYLRVRNLEIECFMPSNKKEVDKVVNYLKEEYGEESNRSNG